MKALLCAVLFVAVFSSAARGEADVCFTPGEDCRSRLAGLIAAARSEVLVQAYSLTSREVVAALAEARRRGVVVRVVLDEGKARQRPERRAVQELAAAEVEVLADAAHAIAHNKVVVVDRRLVATGSYNFSTAAQERNAENLLLLDDEALVRRYLDNWSRHAAHSHPQLPPQSLSRAEEVDD